MQNRNEDLRALLPSTLATKCQNRIVLLVFWINIFLIIFIFQVKWMMYWIVFALFTSLETLTDIFVAFW